MKLLEEPVSINIIPASPGYHVIYEFEEEKEILVGGPIIAWRIATYPTLAREDRPIIEVTPITCEGDASRDASYLGIQNPDKTVTLPLGADYASLEELIQYRYPENKEGG